MTTPAQPALDITRTAHRNNTNASTSTSTSSAASSSSIATVLQHSRLEEDDDAHASPSLLDDGGGGECNHSIRKKLRFDSFEHHNVHGEGTSTTLSHTPSLSPIASPTVSTTTRTSPTTFALPPLSAASSSFVPPKRERTKVLCQSFAAALIIWCAVNVMFGSHRYDTVEYVAVMLMLMACNDLYDADGEIGGLLTLLLCPFVVSRTVQFAFVHFKFDNVVDEDGDIIQLICGETCLYAIAGAMIRCFVVNDAHWCSMHEQIFHRGFARTLRDCAVYFALSACMTMELVHLLCGAHYNDHTLSDLYLMDVAIICAFAMFCACLWFELQRIHIDEQMHTCMIDSLKLRLSQVCAFVVVLALMYCQTFIGSESCKWLAVFGKEYCLLTITIVLILHKLVAR